MSNLIAYIPTLNQRHLNWFKQHPRSNLYLITQVMAEELLPRLTRNMAAVPTEVMIKSIQANRLVHQVSEFAPEFDDPRLVGQNEKSFLGSSDWNSWVLPDEDVSHLVAQKYLWPAEKSAKFEMIWARWDMQAVNAVQPVMPDVQMSSDEFHVMQMQVTAQKISGSPDWWRQIGATAWRGKDLLVTACNTHMPNEYETYIFGDPRLNVDAGQPGKYVALHAERAVIALCARNGISLNGASMSVTTFPCEGCAQEIAFTGIGQLFFRDGYSTLNAQEVLRAYGVKIIQVK